MSFVDEKIVALKFDNRQFEQGAQRSIGMLNKLKSSLNFKNVNAAAGLFKQFGARFANDAGLNQLSNGIERAKGGISSLQVMGITALANITNSAVNAGKQIARAFTIQPVHEGFAEYELKMNSVQTIMASTGEDIQTVNKYLNELNTYADKTIYSFSDMTQNIGKFTNAGVPLKDAVKAIQGISNEAAVSGANANQASHAMYNFAQALSQGSVKLIDWKSIENAQMATVEFKNELINTALELGTLVKEGDMYKSTTKDLRGHTSEAFTATKMFNESLSSQWMTTDVLVKTLGKYSDSTTEIGKKAFAAAQDVKTFSQLMDTLKEAAGSGWASSFELIFGDKEEAKKMWTEVSKVLGGALDSMSKARNDMLKQWKDLGGRDDLLASVRNSYAGLLTVLKPVKEAFTDIFPPLTGKKLADLTKNLRNFTSNLKLSATQSKNLKDTFRGIFTVFKTLGKITSMVAKPIATAFSGFANGVLSITGSIGRLIADGGTFSDILDVIGEQLSFVGNMAKEVFDSFASPFPKGGFVDGLRSFFDSLHQTINGKLNLNEIASKLGGGISRVVTTIKDTLTKMMGDKSMGDVISSGLKLGVGAGIMKFVSDLTGISKNLKKLSVSIATPFKDIGNALKDIFSAITAPFDSVNKVMLQFKSTLEAYQKDLEASTLLKIAAAIAILAFSLKIISTIDPKKLGDALAGMSVIIAEILGAMMALSKVRFLSFGASVGQLLAFAAAIGILVLTLKSLAEMDVKDIAKGVLTLGALMFMLVKAMTVMNSVGGPLVQSTTKSFLKFDKMVMNNPFKGMLTFVVSIAILCEELRRIGQMDVKSILKGLFGISAIMGELLLMSYLMKRFDLGFANIKSGALIGMAISLVIFAKAMEMLGSINPSGILQGLVAMELFMSSYVGVMYAMEYLSGSMSSGRIVAVAASMVIMAEAFKVFSKAMLIYSGMNWSSTLQGLLSFSVMLGGLVASMKLISMIDFDIKSLIVFAAMLTKLSDAFVTFSNAMATYSGMDWSSTIQGLLSFAAMIGGTVGALAAIEHIKVNPTKMISLGAMLLVTAASMKIMAGAMKTISGVDLGGIVKSLGSFAAIIAGLGYAATALSGGVIAKMYALSGVLVVMAAGLLLIAPAMLALSHIPASGVLVMLTAIAGGLLTFILAARALTGAELQLLALGAALIEVAAAFAIFSLGIAGIGIGLFNIAKAIQVFAKLSSEELGNAAKNIGRFIAEITKVIPTVASAMITAALIVLQTLAKNIGPIVKSFVDILMGAFSELVAFIPQFVEVGIEMLTGLIQGLINGIPDLISKGAELVVALCGSIRQAIPDMINAGFDLIFGLLKGIGNGLSGHTGEITEAIASFVQGLTTALSAAIEGVLKGIGRGIGDAIGNIISGALQSLPEIGTKLSEFGDNAKSFFTQMTGMDPSVMQGIKYLAEAIAILTASNIANNNVFTRLLTMGSSFADLGDQLSEFAYSIEDINVSPAVLTSVVMLVQIIRAASNAAKGIPKNGGVLDKIFGSNDMAQFAEKIAETAAAFVPLSALPGLNEGLLTKIQNVLKVVKEMSIAAKGIPKTGGSKSRILGDNDLADFTSKITKSAASLSLLKALPDIGEDVTAKVQTTIDTIKKVSAVAKTLPKTGGIKQVFTGQQDIRPFVDMIKSSVTALSGLSTVTGMEAIDNNLTYRVGQVTKMIGSISTIVTKLPKTGGIKPIVSKITTGEYDIRPFIEMIKRAISSLSGLTRAKGMEVIDETLSNRVGIVTKVISSIANITNKLPKTGGKGKDYKPYDVSGFVEMVASSSRILAKLSKNDALEHIDEDLTSKLSLVTGVIKRVSSISTSLPKQTKGKDGKTQDYYDVSGFVKMLVESAKKISDAAKDASFDGITDELIGQLSKVIGVIKSVVSLSKTMPKASGFDQMMNGSFNIRPFVSMITTAAKSISEFASETDLSTISDDLVGKLTMVTGIVKRVSQLAGTLPKSGGIGDIFTGYASFKPYIDTITKSAKDLAVLGTENLDGISDELVGKLTTVTGVVKRVSQLAQSLAPSDGSTGIFTTNTVSASIQPYVDMIKESATSLADLANGSVNLDNINETFVGKLTTVTAVIKRIMQVSASLGQTNGGSFAAINNFIKGKIDIASMVSKIKDMVKAVKKLTSLDTSGLDLVNTGKLYLIKSAVTQLSEVAKSVKAVKIDKSASASGLITLGKNLKKAVPYFVDFTTQASRVKSTNAEKVKNVVNTMKSVKGVGDGASFKKLGANLKSLGRNMAEFSSTMDGVDTGTIAQKLTDIAEIEVDGSHFEAFGKSVKRSLTNAVKAVNNAAKNFKTAGIKCAKAMVAGAKSQAKQMSAAGKKAGSKFVSGVRSKIKAAKSAGTALASAAKGGVKGGYKDMYSIGQNLGQGVVDGLNSTLGDIREVSGKIADEVDKAIRKKGEIHSPSKRTMRDGEHMGNGFAIGIAKTTKRISSAAKKVAEDGFRQFKLAYNPAVAQLKKFEKDISTVWGRINKVLSKATKTTKNTIYSLAKKDIFGGFIKDSKSVSKYLPNLTKQFGKQFNAKSMMGFNEKDITKAVSNYKNGLKKARKALDQAKKDYMKYSSFGRNPNNKFAIMALAEVKYWESAIKKLEKLAPRLKKLQALSKSKNASTVLNNFAMRLYMQSDEYKNAVKELNSNSKAYNKAIKNQKRAENKQKKAQSKVDKLVKKRDKANKRDDKDAVKKYNKQLKDARRALQAANEEALKARNATDNAAKSLKKAFDAMTKGAEKALKSFRANIKAYVKDVANLSNIQLPEPLFSGFNIDVDADSAISTFDAFSSAAAKGIKTVSNGLTSLSDTAKSAISAASEAYDILSNSADTGINLFEKFTKTGTAEPRALIEIADTQLDAYEELYDGLDKMQKMGFSQDLIDNLESQGINGLNYIRGFLSMGEKEMAEYAAIMERKQKYEDEARMRNMEKQANEYATWMSNIDDVLAKTVGSEFIKKLKAAGVTNANFVSWLVRLPAETLKNVESYYLKSISNTVVEFTQEIPNTISTGVSNAVSKVSSSGSGLLDALLGADSKKSKWESDLAALVSRGVSGHVIESLKQMGQESAQVYVDELLAKAEDGSYKVGETVISQINAVMDKYDPDYNGGFVDALEKSVADRNEWKNILKRLKSLGFSDDVIKKFEEMGQDSGLAMAKSLFEEVDDIDSKLKSKLKEAKDYEAELRKSGNVDDGAVERSNNLWEEYYALVAVKRERIDYVNSLVKENKENSIAAATKNMKAENDSYDQYEKDKKFFRDEIAELKRMGHATTAARYQAVYDALMEGGYESAGLLHDAVDAIIKETNDGDVHKFASKTIFAFYDELERRKKVNSKESWFSVKNFFPDVKDLQNNYGDLMDWATKHMFTNLDDKKKDKNGYTQRDRAIQEFLSQAESLGVDGAVELLQSMQWAFTNDKSGFNSVMKQFYETNFTVPNSVANKVTNDFAVAYEGAVGDFTKKLGTAITNMSKTITKNVTKAVGPIGNSGKEIGKKITSSVKASTDELKTTLPKTITNKKFINTVTTSGKTVGKAIGKGISSSVKASANGLDTTVSDAITGNKVISSVKSSGNKIGKAISKGMSTGIENNMSTVIDAAVTTASEALAAAKEELGINSPSRAFAEIGRYVDEGFAQGLTDNASIPAQSIEALSNSLIAYMVGAASMISDQVNQDVVFDPEIVVDETKAKALDTMRQAIESMILLANDEIDTNPVITPELDLSEVRQSAQDMSAIVNETQSKLNAPALDQEIQNGSNSGVTYIQNNYSPKALSPLEVYRMSENLIARTRGMVRA